VNVGGHSLYQNNSAGYSPYGACNINIDTGCDLDPRCTLFQQCIPLAAADMQKDSNGTSTQGIRPHRQMTENEYQERKALIDKWLKSPQAEKLIAQGQLEIGDKIRISSSSQEIEIST
jgi:hypothetical protein